MRLNELFEKHNLRLRRDTITTARGRYAAFIAVMSPEDFISLTTRDDVDISRIKSGAESRIHDEEEYLSLYGDDGQFGRYDIPFLHVQFPSGRVTGHEGRHRAAMVIQKGGTSFPVMIVPYSDEAYYADIFYIDDKDQDRKETLGPFGDPDSAESAASDFQKDAEAVNPEIYHFRTKIRDVGNAKLKGGPDSVSSNFEYTKWKVEDFPSQLIGQFNETIRVSNFRVGLVKGYRHQK